MVPVQQAVESAAAFATSILGKDRTTGLQLEEVEIGKHLDRDVWQITLSMLRPNPFVNKDTQTVNNAVGLMPSLSFARDYKTLIVDCETGEVRSMKIRELVHSE
jgi:hypothetical protein